MIRAGRTVPTKVRAMSPAPDSTLADTQRSNADLQRELAELRRTLDEALHERDEALHERDDVLRERDEALQRETATAEVLGVINSSPGDLAPVFDAMLEKAIRLCEAAFGVLRTFDGRFFHLVAVRGEGPFVERAWELGPIRSDVGLFDRLVAGDDVVHTPDVYESDVFRLDTAARTRSETGGIRSCLHVALRKEGVLLGTIIVFRQEVRPFTAKQIALLQNFAAQAVIAMENARLITETRGALEQQTATAEVLGVINSSPGDLVPVFDAMLEKALRLCDASFGILSTREGDGLRRRAVLNLPPDLDEFLAKEPLDTSPNTFVGRAFRERKVIHIADILEAEPYRRGVPLAVATYELAGARTMLWVPLIKDDAALGVFTIYRTEVRPFSDKQIALLQNFAAQAVIAMENARLITETRDALERQTATAEVLGVINASPGDLAPVFDAMLEKALRLCEAAFGALHSFDGESVHTVALRNVPRRFAEFLTKAPLKLDPEQSLLGKCIYERQTVHVADRAAEGYAEGLPLAVAAVELGGIRALLHVPLVRDEIVLGAFTIYRQEVRPFSDKQIALLQNFAAQAVIAMENARLITETREALEQQTATAEVLGVINSSPGNLVPVFDAILEKARSLCDVTHGALTLFDGEYFRAVATHGYSEKHAEAVRTPFRPRAVHERLLGGERYVHFADAMELADRLNDEFSQAFFRHSGLRTLLHVPLRKDENLIGYISAARSEVRPFSEKEIALLENFAAQAVIAMENARLLGELRQRNDEIAGWNRELETRVADQLAELERTGKLRRFLAPQLADLIIAQGDESILESHRREIVVVFCDIRGFTAFAERAEPEEVMALLRDYHAALGPIVARYEGTLDHYSGDGVMVFFNDPLPTPEPAKRAIEMAAAMREAAQQVLKTWRRHGHDLGFGVGISQGYATLGQIGFAERMDYTAIGTVCNLAARLCDEAKDGQILISRRVAVAVEEDAKLEEIGEVSLKGLSQAVAVYNVVQ